MRGYVDLTTALTVVLASIFKSLVMLYQRSQLTTEVLSKREFRFFLKFPLLRSDVFCVLSWKGSDPFLYRALLWTRIRKHASRFYT